MKELLQYYNSITDERAKFELLNVCNNYFDPDQPDGYKKSEMDKSKEELLTSTTNYNFDRQFWTLAYLFQTISYDEMKSMMYDKENILTRLYRENISGKRVQNILLMLNSEDYRDLTYKLVLDEYHNDTQQTDSYMAGRLEYLLLFNKDFSEKGRQKLFETIFAKYKSGEAWNAFTNKDLCFELFGKDNMKQVWKEDPEYITLNNNRLFEKYSDLFDELFFCENGWDDSQKKDFINRSNYTQENFQRFVKYILSVDMSYIKNLYQMLRYDTALINALANELKPNEELTAGMTYPQKYRYPKKFRDLLKVLYVCIKGKCAKTRANQLKEVASIAKLYSYDFNLVCEAMYPEAFEVA